MKTEWGTVTQSLFLKRVAETYLSNRWPNMKWNLPWPPCFLRENRDWKLVICGRFFFVPITSRPNSLTSRCVRFFCMMNALLRNTMACCQRGTPKALPKCFPSVMSTGKLVAKGIRFIGMGEPSSRFLGLSDLLMLWKVEFETAYKSCHGRVRSLLELFVWVDLNRSLIWSTTWLDK